MMLELLRKLRVHCFTPSLSYLTRNAPLSAPATTTPPPAVMATPCPLSEMPAPPTRVLHMCVPSARYFATNASLSPPLTRLLPPKLTVVKNDPVTAMLPEASTATPKPSSIFVLPVTLLPVSYTHLRAHETPEH